MSLPQAASSSGMERLKGSIFRAADVIAQGWLTSRQLESKAWSRVLRGVYAGERVPRNHATKCRAAMLVIPAEAVITGASAAWFQGVELAGPGDPVEVITPQSRRFGPVRGLRIRRSAIPPEEIRPIDGVRVTGPLRTAWEIAANYPLREALVLLDALANLGRVNPRILRDYLAKRPRAFRRKRVARAFRLVDGRAESPQESRLRAEFILAHLPPPTPQFVVTRDGRFVARVDLAYERYKIAIEYDGVWHADKAQLRRDRRRLNALQAAGWLVFHVTAADMYNLEPLFTEVRAAIAARG